MRARAREGPPAVRDEIDDVVGIPVSP